MAELGTARLLLRRWLVPTAWGNGYATEAARAAIAYGLQTVGLDEIVSFTSVVNERSQRVMERLGMRHDPRDDFDHPAIAAGPLRRHVLYRMATGDGAVPS
jgi:RimJ/RimL family protein N-acetyltransferase